MYSVFLIDDHHMILQGLKRLFEGEDWLMYKGHASSIEEAVNKLEHSKELPQIIITDVKLPDGSGLDIVKKFSGDAKQVRCIVYSMIQDPGIIEEAKNSGASAFIGKHQTAEKLLEIMKNVAKGYEFFEKLDGSQNQSKILNQRLLNILSNQEKQILRMVIVGKTSTEIAEELHLSKRTIDNYRSSILKKTQSRNTAELVSKF